MLDRRLDIWLPQYIAETFHRARMRRVRSRQLTHVLFLVCDHFEPRHAAREPGQPEQRLKTWLSQYAEMQNECHARHGLRPLHSWFYPPHHGNEHLTPLARLAFEGLGEVELHLHHTHDTEDTLRALITKTLHEFRQHGLLMQLGDPPGTGFGFIHGDWALDNSFGGGEFCGVDSELQLLEELGCWADLTLPSGGRCQTRKINSIYRAVDDVNRPKSHNWGADARTGAPREPGLLLMQGPLALNWGAPRHPVIENASLTTSNWGRPDRIRSWLDCHVHVRGRPEWLFVKLHTHGAVEQDFDALFGERARRMHRTLAEQFNDGRQFRLHYVTARQAYNVARAAEHGEGGDPSSYFDFEVKPPVTSQYMLDALHRLACCTPDQLRIEAIAAGGEVRLSSHYPLVRSIAGPLAAISLNARTGALDLRLHEADAEVELVLPEGGRLQALDGARVLGTRNGSIRVACGRTASLRLESQEQPQAVSLA